MVNFTVCKLYLKIGRAEDMKHTFGCSDRWTGTEKRYLTKEWDGGQPVTLM